MKYFLMFMILVFLNSCADHSRHYHVLAINAIILMKVEKEGNIETSETEGKGEIDLPFL